MFVSGTHHSLHCAQHQQGAEGVRPAEFKDAGDKIVHGSSHPCPHCSSTVAVHPLLGDQRGEGVELLVQGLDAQDSQARCGSFQQEMQRQVPAELPGISRLCQFI